MFAALELTDAGGEYVPGEEDEGLGVAGGAPHGRQEPRRAAHRLHAAALHVVHVIEVDLRHDVIIKLSPIMS